MARDVLRMYDPRYIVDHINGDTLDNRKCNLRIATLSQNRANGRKIKPKSSKYKGVSMVPRKNGVKWEAYIFSNYVKTHLATCETEEQAARIYNRAAKKVWGEFARLNVIRRKKINDNSLVTS